MTTRRAIALLLLVGCSRCETDGSDALEALYASPALFMQSAMLETAPERETLIERLEALDASVDELGLSVEARIVLQNDLWGLNRRASARELSDPLLVRIASLSAAIARRIAPDDVRDLAPPDALPEVRDAFDGLVEHGTEMPVLSHEAVFGLRRVFRIALSVDRSRRAIFSQLVAFDRAGRIGVTHVVGEIEHLEFHDGALTRARVWKRTHGRTPTLDEVDAIMHVPSLGADSFFLQENEPVRLAALPCMRCHVDDDPHSLPSPEIDVRPRWQRVIEQLAVPSVGE